MASKGFRVTVKNEQGVWVDFHIKATYLDLNQVSLINEVIGQIKEGVTANLGWSDFGIAAGDTFGQDGIGKVRGEYIG